MTLQEHADRLRAYFSGDPRIVEKRGFGSIMFMLNGNLCAAINKEGRLLVRAAPEDIAAALARDGASTMESGSRTMTGFISVAPYAVEDDEGLLGWMDFAVASVTKLPPKDPAKPARKPRRH